MTKALNEGDKIGFKPVITEMYGPYGAPKTWKRSRGSHWIETANDDGTISRTYCDAVSWQQSLDEYNASFDFPPRYGEQVIDEPVNDGKELTATVQWDDDRPYGDDGREDWRAADGYEDCNEDPWAITPPKGPHPAALVTTAAVFTAVAIVGFPVWLLAWLIITVNDAIFGKPQRDWGLEGFISDLASLWRGKLPEDF